MKRFVLHYSESHPEYLFDPFDEWKTQWLGYFFVSPQAYDSFKKAQGSGKEIRGHLYTFEDRGLDRDRKLSALELRKAQQYVEELPDGDVGDIREWVDAHAVDHDRDRFSEMYNDYAITDEAIEFFETHLVDDPHTVKMLEYLYEAEDRHRAWGLRDVMDGALFLRALDLCGVDRAEDLPFELSEETCMIINGSRTKSAMEEHCTYMEVREAAATLNMLDRKCRGKKLYQWTRDAVMGGSIENDCSTLMSVASGYY